MPQPLCHEATRENRKRPLNIYGRALKLVQVVATWKERGKAQPRNAFEAIEGHPSAIEGKTFGDLIKEGKLPAARE